MLRITPWILTIICANVLHYRSLWTAKEESREKIQALKKISETANKFEHEPLTFDLMRSPAMRKARYKIKLLRYSATSIYILLFQSYLPELHENCTVNSKTLESIIVGLLSGLITVYLNENQDEAMRTLWRPIFDFRSRTEGQIWDTIRLLGATLAVPFEEELFYHSWMYRYIVHILNRNRYKSFVDVSFLDWSWTAWIISNLVKGLYNGKEWRSYLISGLLFQWMIGRRGSFMDGVLSHAVSNLTVGGWVLATDQRQYW